MRICVLATVVILVYLISSSECSTDRVLLTDIKALTLRKNMMTTSRRSSPINQLTCIGGSAMSSNYHPTDVQCINVGSDGYDVQWECKADLDESVKFGAITVSCEGYDYAGDSYVLRGSCGLEYELEYTSKGKSSSSSSSNSYYDGGYYYDTTAGSTSGGMWGSLFTFLVLSFILYAVFQACTTTAHHNYNAGGAPGGAPGGYPGGPGGYGGYPGGPGGYGGYPGGPGGYGGFPGYGSYGSSGNGGFWTGMATGGLLSSFLRPSYGYNYGGGYTPYRRTGGTFGGSSFGGSSGGFSSSGGSRVASGFGGTRRR
eukprot:TRINITY_DN2996_c0_g1_i1.p1 TRINITY_DN2996_c0_g1~~TRINITY_DN2996_c0_g1_i1.p1  ORF type:complete len:329 (+),score=65.28 TRINITY_DN2996_c0_g1_i1:51-989(+)